MMHNYKKNDKIKLTGKVVNTKVDSNYLWIEINDYIGGVNTTRVLVHCNAISKLTSLKKVKQNENKTT